MLIRRFSLGVASVLLSSACSSGNALDPDLDGEGANSPGGLPTAGRSGSGSGGAIVSGGMGGHGGGGRPSVGGAGSAGTAPAGGGTPGGNGGALNRGGLGNASGGMAAGRTGQGGASFGGTGEASGVGGTPGVAGATGGTGVGGTMSSDGLGPWTSGYVATMYGDISAGDCVPYSANFSDHTAISSYTCVLGTGPRQVTLSAYAAGAADNASYYAALGDLSDLWTVNGAAGACTCNGSTSAACNGPSCAAEISSNGACGICVAVKCDPNSTYKDSSGFSHDSACNTTSYVVVQNIDACPHNHTTNISSASGWCTEKQAQHIDLSCSGLGDISNLGTNVGQQGWLPVSVQVVDCSIGLGKHAL